MSSVYPEFIVSEQDVIAWLESRIGGTEVRVIKTATGALALYDPIINQLFWIKP